MAAWKPQPQHERNAMIAELRGTMSTREIGELLGVGATTIQLAIRTMDMASGRDPKDPPPPIAPRDPCYRCGVRADHGCRCKQSRIGWSVGR